MSFFAQAAANAPKPSPPEPERAMPPWFGPPSDVVPALSPQQAVLFHTDRAILVIRRFEVYPTGVEFTVDLRVKPTDEPRFEMPWDPLASQFEPTNGPLPDEFLRLGFSFADGTTWTNLGDSDPGVDDEPTAPVVAMRGGSGDGHRWEMRCWMWPLPPAGDVVTYAAWPLFEIDEVSAVLDGTAFGNAAEAAEQIWD